MSETQTYVDLQDAGNAQAQLILQAIARHADWETGECWPGELALARMSKCTTRTVRTYLKRLEDDGLILRDDRRRHDGTKLRKRIVLVGYAEWIRTLRSGGTVRAPKAIRKYSELPESLSYGPEENLSYGGGQFGGDFTSKKAGKRRSEPEENLSGGPEEKFSNTIGKAAYQPEENRFPTHIDELQEEPQEEQKRARDAQEGIWIEDGRIRLNAEQTNFWLPKFGGDEERLALALIEAAAYVQPNGMRSVFVQVSSQLARRAADKRDRDGRYSAAASKDCKPKPALRVVDTGPKKSRDEIERESKAFFDASVKKALEGYV